MKALNASFILSMTLLASGCSAIRTTMLTRHEEEQISVDPVSPLKGIPVMLRVPSHLELEIVETTYLTLVGTTLKPIEIKRHDRELAHKLVYTEKMFLVDPKRVFSGSGGYGFGFDNTTETEDDGRGYLSSIDYKAVDTTIQDSASLLANVIPILSGRTGVGDKDDPTEQLITSQRTVAYRRFDLASPSLQYDVEQFLNDGLNDTAQYSIEELPPQ